jgi:predicted ester cyclase
MSGSGTHRGELFGTAPTGKRVVGVTSICVTRIAKGKVVEDNWVYDALGMLRQLGVVPAPVAKAA